MSGRPSDYSSELGQRICEELIKPRTLLDICKDEWAPGRATIYRWLNDNEEFRDMYARAKEMQADAYVDEIMDISDDGSNDWMERQGKHGEVFTVVDHEHIQRSRLRVDTRKWFAAKVLPKRYGDKPPENNTSQEQTGPSIIALPLEGGIESI